MVTRLDTLIDKRGQAWDRTQALLEDIRDRDVTPDERRELDRLDEDLKRWSEEVEAIMRTERIPQSETDDGGRLDPGALVLRSNQRLSDWAIERGLFDHRQGEQLRFGHWLRGAATGDWTGAEPERRAMAENTLAAGGAMVPTPLAAQIIDRARAIAATLRAGAVTVPMTSQTLRIARVAGDPSAAWHSESAVIAESDMTFESVELKAKTLPSLVRASRELVEDGHDVQGVLEHAFASQLALTLDRAALYGSGVDPEPRGTKLTTGVTQTSLGANGGPVTYDALIDASAALWSANETPTAAIHSPRTEQQLAKLKDTTGQYLAPPKALDSLPRYATNQVPTNLTVGTSTTTSDSFVGDFSQLLIGVRTGLAIEVLRERYADRFELGFLAHLRADVAVARPGAFVVVTGITA
jgi:HK97 family phage major capsid protein